MKTLILIRHAEAGWDDFAQTDVDRSLTKRGVRQADQLAIAMIQKGLKPALILSSAAKRAEQTTHGLCAGGVCQAEQVEWRTDLYLAEPKLLLEAIAKADDELQSLAIVAHNPGLSELADSLVDEHVEGLAPSNLIVIVWDAESWTDISNMKGNFKLRI